MNNEAKFTDIHDWITELVEPRTHREPYTQRRGSTTYTAGHLTRVPSLIDQLLNASTPTSSGDSTGPGGFASQPAAHLEALDTLARIDLAAARWVRDLGEDDPGDTLKAVRVNVPPYGPTCATCRHQSCRNVRRGTTVVRVPIPGTGTAACLRLLHGLHASAHRCGPKRRGNACCPAHAIEHDVRSWWTAARVMTGWDSPAFRPNNTCPICGKRGGLRVRLDGAVCIHCHETWTADTIGLLAEHIRGENGEDTPNPDAA